MNATSEEFIRVSEAKRRYLSNTMSLRWWYRQIEDGRLAHFGAGTAVVLRIADVDAFVAELFREKAKPEEKDESSEAPRVAVSKRSRKSGFRFFN